LILAISSPLRAGTATSCATSVGRVARPHPRARLTRRTAVAAVATCAPGFGVWSVFAAQSAPHPQQQWYEAAVSMRRLAESWGDQPYGAVVVLDGQLLGEGPSRVVKKHDDSAHAEREAIRDAQARSGKMELHGAVLYSTSRPCRRCEAAAAKAGVARMYFGSTLTDAGTPRYDEE
jgi:tRNA(adenine34) deaminase